MARSQRLRVFIRPRLERVVYVVTRLARTCLLKVFDHSLHDHRLEAQLKATSLTVSIIIPVKDSLSRGLPELVASLKSQTHSNIEIIAVDSGSTDDTKEWLRTHGVKALTIRPESFNHAASRNIGAAHANGQWLLFTVDDAVFSDPDWITSALQVLEITKSVALSSKQVCHRDASLHARTSTKVRDDLFLGIRSFAVTRTGFVARFLHKLLPLKFKAAAVALDSVNLLISKAVFTPYQFRAESNEDRELAMRLARDGQRIVFARNLAVTHSHSYGYKDLKSFAKRIYLDTQTTQAWDLPTHQQSISTFLYCSLSVLLEALAVFSSCRDPATRRAACLEVSHRLQTLLSSRECLRTVAPSGQPGQIDRFACRFVSSLRYRVLCPSPMPEQQVDKDVLLRYRGEFLHRSHKFFSLACQEAPTIDKQQFFLVLSLLWCDWVFSRLARSDAQDAHDLHCYCFHWKISQWR
jgi:GT2 family glycosyltransferase